MDCRFERLDTEMNDHSICSTGKVAKEEIHPLLEHDISSEIHRSSKGEGSVMFEKLDIEDSGYSTGNLSPVKTQPILEHGSSEIHRSTKWQSSFLTKVDIYSSDAEDEYDEWMLKMMKMGANDDMSYLYKVDQEAKHPVHCDQLDGYDLTDEEVENYPKNMKKFSYRGTIQNGFKWMSEECFLAFRKYAENLNLVGIEHKFGEILHQCFNVESDGNTFHHFNFTIDSKRESGDTWISEEYFAEVKQEFGIKSYFCHLLRPEDEGDCNGCKSQDVSKLQLRHPLGGGYKKGDADICWPFDVDSDCDSDSSDDAALAI